MRMQWLNNGTLCFCRYALSLMAVRLLEAAVLCLWM